MCVTDARVLEEGRERARVKASEEVKKAACLISIRVGGRVRAIGLVSSEE